MELNASDDRQAARWVLLLSSLELSEHVHGAGASTWCATRSRCSPRRRSHFHRGATRSSSLMRQTGTLTAAVLVALSVSEHWLQLLLLQRLLP